MMLIKNKKGAEKYLSPWLFLVWAIIGVGMVIGALIFYSAKIDVREEEADILSTKLIDCIVDNGYLNDIFKKNIFEKCNLNEEMFYKGGDFYFNISISDFKSGKILEIKKGEDDLVFQCMVGKDEEHFARCSEKIIYALNKSNNSQKFTIKITTASNQLGAKL